MTRKTSRIANALALGLIVFTALIPILRPGYLSWGSTTAELRAALPGDELAPSPDYQVQHGVTIASPAQQVWPWLAQIGQDKAGFYSYSLLENLVGLRIRNAQSIHPEWQDIQAGDLVRAVPPGWFGGRFDANPGWRVARVDPGRAIVLQNWGAFVLLPVDEHTTRLVIRSRGHNRGGVAAAALAPVGAMVFEPIHFLMQRRMMIGIKERAERFAPPVPGTMARVFKPWPEPPVP
jgi:hypothetical protein